MPILDDCHTLMQRQAAIQQLYALTAHFYEARIAPVMLPFARYLVESTGLEAQATVLDVGTGTGLVTREAAARARWVMGIDIAMPMLCIAQTLRPDNARFVLADAQTLDCLAGGSFDAALSCFGLGDTDPRRSLPAVARTLKPGGRFALLAWGPFDGPDDPRRIVDDTLAAYTAGVSAALHPAFDPLLAENSPWELRLQDTEDYLEALAANGLEVIEARESRPVTVMLNPAAFIAYALAWAPRRLAVESLSAAAQRALYADLYTRLARKGNRMHKKLAWQPILFHIISVRRSKPCVNACSGL